MPQKQIVLPADVYDALELSALVHGGIGAECFTVYEDTDDDTPPPPLCVVGHAEFLDNTRVGNQIQGPVVSALAAALEIESNAFGPLFAENDRAVRKLVNGDETVQVRNNARVTWEQWCKETGVVRGE